MRPVNRGAQHATYDTNFQLPDGRANKDPMKWLAYSLIREIHDLEAANGGPNAFTNDYRTILSNLSATVTGAGANTFTFFDAIGPFNANVAGAGIVNINVGALPFVMMDDLPKAISAMQDSLIINNFPTVDNIRKIAKLADLGDYGFSRPGLIDRLGPFCSYCEQPVERLEVEHVLPKARFRSLSLSWSNFLLACKSCNTRKSNKPSQNDIFNSFPGVAGPAYAKLSGRNIPTPIAADDRLTDREYLREVVHSYLTPLNNNSYRAISYQLKLLDPANAGAGFVNDVNGIVAQMAYSVTNFSVPGHYVEVDINPNGPPTIRRARLSIRANPGAGANLQAAANRTINGGHGNLCDLNRVDTNDANDRRVLKRTETWFTALAFLSNLNSLITNQYGNNVANLPQSVFNVWWSGLLSAAKTSGFYSVWVTVLNAKDDPFLPQVAVGGGPPAPQRLAIRFRDDTSNNHFFPGTNPANVP